MDAASRQDARGMHWHTAMIQWCLHLRHRSSGAYEELRGVLKLPSQRMLRDCTHYIKFATGFSTEVDQMLVRAAKVGSCPQCEKHTILLIDEMHIHKHLVYHKHTGERVGFATLGDINQHLLAFEHSLSTSTSHHQPLATTMMVFMIQGLFSKLHFPYGLRITYTTVLCIYVTSAVCKCNCAFYYVRKWKSYYCSFTTL